MSTTDLFKKYLTVTQAAAHIGVTSARVRQMMVDGTMSGSKIPGDSSGRWLIHQSEVERVKRDIPKTGRPRSGIPK